MADIRSGSLWQYDFEAILDHTNSNCELRIVIIDYHLSFTKDSMIRSFELFLISIRKAQIMVLLKIWYVDSYFLFCSGAPQSGS